MTMIFDFLIDAQFKYRTFDIFQTFLSLNRELEYTENRCESSLTRTIMAWCLATRVPKRKNRGTIVASRDGLCHHVTVWVRVRVRVRIGRSRLGLDVLG